MSRAVNAALVTTRRASLRWVLAALTPLAIFVALAAWAFASPVGSSPDDDFHLPSIWCGLGERAGLCAEGSSPAERMVPQALLSASCYAVPGEARSARCLPDLDAPDQLRLAPTARGNFSGLYPPIYYAVVGVFASRHIELSVITIRLFNAALFVASITALSLLLPRRLRIPLVLGWCASLVQLGMFVLGSDNPSSWALISAGGLWLAVAGYLEARGGRRLALGAIAVVLTIMGSGARADSAIYSALSVCLAVLVTMRWERSFWPPKVLWLPAALVITALLLYRAASQGDNAVAGLDAGAAQSTLSGHALLLSNLLALPKLYAGAFGLFGPTSGWTNVNTAAPAVTWVPALIVYGAVIFWGLTSMSWRKALALVVVGTALVAVPLFVLQEGRHDVGQTVQPRYLLPLMLIFAAVACLPGNRAIPMPSPAQAVAGVGLLVTANAVAIFTDAKRFTLGATDGSFNLNTHHVWWWHLAAPLPLTVIGIGSVAFLAALTGCALLLRPSFRALDGFER